MKQLLFLSVVVLAFLSGCTNSLMGDDSSFDNYPNSGVLPARSNGDESFMDNGKHTNDQYMEGGRGTHLMDNVGGSDDSAEVPFSASRRPGTTESNSNDGMSY